jgi:hypothetical protein
MISIKNIVQVSIAAGSLVVASLAIGWGTAHAQIGGGGGGGFGGQGGGIGGPMPRQNGAFQPMQGPMNAGGVAITADHGFLFVVHGNELIKVQESDMEVSGRTQLGPRGYPPPPPPPSGGFGGGGQGG